MRLTSYTDYALRSLMYLAINRERLVTIQDIADTNGIAKNHLTKVIHHLGMLGIVETVRGRSGGLRLAREPSEINIGAVIRETEPDFQMAECFDIERNSCAHTSSCRLRGMLGQATGAFLQVLDNATLEDVVGREAGRAASHDRPLTAAAPLHFRPKALARSR